ncbi:hypothetical protein ISN44_As11g012330 [Arabidopsis suecica]|uniref:PH domain-containing protein n=1 Tax=Arabidopsis suecica TaxID=45249 RepID=A0A8T1ZAC8_ARASU|nr:hypothetical protein ISN44_As11g012330 [Arabidopsis suecica]
MKKSQSKHILHSSSFSSASATAVSDATTTPFASRFLFGNNMVRIETTEAFRYNGPALTKVDPKQKLLFPKSNPPDSDPKGDSDSTPRPPKMAKKTDAVVVREDKNLLTVLFPDGCDGRAFTLKAETLDDLYEWKAALEQALAQAPNAALVIGQNGIFRTEANNTIEASFNSWRDQRPLKSSVVGRPILQALEETDGSPNFLEKAMQFLETYGEHWPPSLISFLPLDVHLLISLLSVVCPLED